MTAPNFLIIGAARSGTTALARFLDEHPAVFMSKPKEPHFLGLGQRTAPFAGPGDDEMMNRVRVSDAESYERLFAGAEGEIAIGEGSVSTLYYGTEAIPRIHQYCAPDTKLIVVLRNPVERAFSAFLYLRSRGHEHHEDFRAGLADEASRVAQGYHHMWHYTGMSRYSQQLPAFVDAFGDRLKVVLHDDLDERPAETLRDVFGFLGVPPVEIDTDAEINRSGEAKSELLHRAMKRMRSVESVRQAVKKVVPSSVRDRIRSANLTHPAMSSEAHAQLSELMTDDVAYVTALTDGRAATWRG